jgi:CheY-like chemotaxis protein
MHKVMVVDDNDDTRSFLATLFQHYGFQPITTVTAEEALELYPKVQPHAIVLDVRLPGIDGCEAARRFREKGFTGPLFLTSAYYDLVEARIASTVCDGFFPKSKDPLQIARAVKEKLAPELPEVS